MEYLNIFNDKYKEIAQREAIFPVFRFELLDAYDNSIMDLTDSVIFDDSGSISVNYNIGVRRSCTFSLINTSGRFSVGDDKSYLRYDSKIKIYMGLRDIYTSDTYMFSQGVFYISTYDSNRENKTITLNCVDKFGYMGAELGYNKLTDVYKIPSGNTMYRVLKDILMIDMGNSHVLDYAEPILSSTYLSYLFPYDLVKSPNSYIGDIVTDISKILGADMYYNTDGHLTLTDGSVDMSYSTQGAIWDFSDVLPEYSESGISTDISKVINSVTIAKTNTDSDFLFYTAENTNPLSPTAVQNIGRKEYYEENQSIPDKDRIKDYAEYLLNRYSILQQTITFATSALPHMDVDKVINVSDSYYKYNKMRFIIQGLTIPLSFSSKMSVTACNVSSLPYYDFNGGE